MWKSVSKQEKLEAIPLHLRIVLLLDARCGMSEKNSYATLFVDILFVRGIKKTENMVFQELV
jgi:hypothetical protein